MNQDQEHLRLLAIFHYVAAGLFALCSCVPVIHLTLGIAIVAGALDNQPSGEPPPPFVGWMFIVISIACILLGWCFAVCLAVAGYLLQHRRGYMFCMVMAAFACANAPLGTVLGVFTILVLLRPSVKELFGRSVALET